MEIWKTIKEFENYQVSNLGNVKSFYSKDEKILKPHLNGAGYLSLNLYKEKKSYPKQIHQLVFETFKNIKSNRNLVIDHKDNNKLNNNLENLQLISNRENSFKDKKQKSNHYCIYQVKRKNCVKFMVRLRVNNVKKTLGTYNDIFSAISVRDNFIKSII